MSKKFLTTRDLAKNKILSTDMERPESFLPEFEDYDHKVKYVVLGIPSYGSGVTFPTFRSIMRDVAILANMGIVVEIDADVGGAEIDTARAKIFSKFLAHDKATDLVFIDADVGWHPGGLAKLLANPVHFVGGAYPQRRYPIQYPVNISSGQCVLFNGLMSVISVPGGFMRITHEVAEAMADKYSVMRCGVARAPGEKVPPVYALFDHYWIEGLPGEDKRRLSEDISFCRRYGDLGGQVWLDPSIEMSHTGDHTFQGCLGAAFEDEEHEAYDPRDPAIIALEEEGKAD